MGLLLTASLTQLVVLVTQIPLHQSADFYFSHHNASLGSMTTLTLKKKKIKGTIDGRFRSIGFRRELNDLEVNKNYKTYPASKRIP